MGQVGARVPSPLGLMREYLPALRALLAGEQVSTTGQYVSLDRVQLDWPPAAQPPILMGALGPRSMALCGEVADGILIDSITTTDGIREALSLIAEGWQASGRPGDPQVAAYTRTYGEDERELPAVVVAQVVTDRFRAGATTVVLQPSATTQDIESYLAFVRDEVRPLIGASGI
jgi:alkanesulfonate monooxygenase SsuD/methylene tetrahydromethanopterin reductase-like flavin-dependent oxidoreductase (luciferase family)